MEELCKTMYVLTKGVSLSILTGIQDHEAVPGDVLTQVLARVPRSTGFKVSPELDQ